MEKVILDKGGCPMVFKHDGSGKASGRILTRKERDMFATESLMNLYRMGGTKAHRYLKPSPDYPDFALEHKTDLWKSFIVRSVDDMDDRPEYDPSAAIRLYHQFGTHPRLALVQLNCMETGSSTECIAGGRYTLTVRYESLGDDNHMDDGYEGERKTQAELTEILAEAWNRRDASVVAPYISDDVVYESAWVHDMLVGKKEYMDNLIDRFGYMSHTVRMEIETNLATGDLQMKTISNPINTLTVHVKDGFITHMKMCDYDRYASKEYMQYGTKGDFI